MSFPVPHPPPSPGLSVSCSLPATTPSWGLAPEDPHGSRSARCASTARLSWEQPGPWEQEIFSHG